MKVGKGRPAIGRKTDKKELKRLYVKESKSIREVAEVLRCTKDMVYRSLKEYGIQLRPGFNRSRLRKYKISILEKGIREKGIRAYAKELGVHENTLRYYLRGVREGK
ncbi:MAG: hypothetical protein KAV87_47830 [Desulfobacteraceae bacterium]|nr:hypothetical protein [Desulfobacteraceae bacterium]